MNRVFAVAAILALPIGTTEAGCAGPRTKRSNSMRSINRRSDRTE